MREMVLAAIIDYFNNSNGYFRIDSSKIDRNIDGPEHRINGWFSLGDLADAVVVALANKEMPTECTSSRRR